MPHTPDIRRRKALDVGSLCLNESGKVRDYGFAPSAVLDLVADIGADFPVHRNQLSVHGSKGILAGTLDDGYNLAICNVVIWCQFFAHIPLPPFALLSVSDTGDVPLLAQKALFC